MYTADHVEGVFQWSRKVADLQTAGWLNDVAWVVCLSTILIRSNPKALKRCAGGKQNNSHRYDLCADNTHVLENFMKRSILFSLLHIYFKLTLKVRLCTQLTIDLRKWVPWSRWGFTGKTLNSVINHDLQLWHWVQMYEKPVGNTFIACSWKAVVSVRLFYLYIIFIVNLLLILLLINSVL